MFAADKIAKFNISVFLFLSEDIKQWAYRCRTMSSEIMNSYTERLLKHLLFIKYSHTGDKTTKFY